MTEEEILNAIWEYLHKDTEEIVLENLLKNMVKSSVERFEYFV